MEKMTHCPICGNNCNLNFPKCHKGKDLAKRMRDGGEYVHEEHHNDYGQHNHGYDPEGLADPEAHNYQPDHISRMQPQVKQRNWDLDSDEDFLGDFERLDIVAADMSGEGTPVGLDNPSSPNSAGAAAAAPAKADRWVQQAAPICPGCRMGCSLDDPSCGKGYDLQQDWHSGRELKTVRSQGRAGGRRRGHDRESDLMRVRYLLEACAAEVKQQTECLDAGQFLEMLQRQGGFMKFRVLEDKARLEPAKLKELLPKLEKEGLIEVDWDAVTLTDKGEAAALAAGDDADAVCADVFSGLAVAEQAQLGHLLHTLIHSLRDRNE